MSEQNIRHYRAMFLSDVHLGTRGCQAELLLDFLKQNEADKVFLVGDIVDGWRLKSGWFWPQAHNDVVQKFLRKVRKGTQVVYIPGNHDEFLRDYEGMNFGGIEIQTEAIYQAADGKRYLVLHGDKYDVVVRNIRWLAYLGDWAYDLAITLNTVIGYVRRHFGLSYWSFSGWSKSKVKRAVNYIGAFEKAVVSDAQRHDVFGVICGHIHHPIMRTIDNYHYINLGDWIESCSALVEHHDGRLELLYWANQLKKKPILETDAKRLKAVA